jgi:hypothetical protein
VRIPRKSKGSSSAYTTPLNWEKFAPGSQLLKSFPNAFPVTYLIQTLIPNKKGQKRNVTIGELEYLLSIQVGLKNN